MLRGILDPLAAGQQHAPRGGRLIGRQIPDFAGGEARARGQQIRPILGLAQCQEVERVRLAHDHGLRRAPQGTAEDAVRSVGGVVAGEEQGAVVRGPLQPVAHAVDRVREQPAAPEILHPDGVPLRAGGVVGECEQPAVGAHLAHPHVRVGAPAPEQVLVQQHLLSRREAAALAAEDGILLAFHGSGVVVVAVLQLGHGQVGLLDPRDHFAEQALLQLAASAGHPLGVGVLGTEVSEDLGPLAPVVTQPGVGIGPRHARDGVHVCPDRGDGCRHRLGPRRAALGRQARVRHERGRSERHGADATTDGDHSSTAVSAPAPASKPMPCLARYCR